MAKIRKRILLLIHGVIDDDPHQRWRASLDAALRREGGPGLTGLGWETPYVSYRDILEGDEPTSVEMLSDTHQAADDAGRLRAMTDYHLRLIDLQRRLVEADEGTRPIWTPPTPASSAAVKVLWLPMFRRAREYKSSKNKRTLILRRVLTELPAQSELVIIGHSLGSVVAADLVYHLPRSCTLRLLITTGSPMAIPDLRKHLRRVERSFPLETVGAWLNVAGAADPVAGGRGLARLFPEVLDRVVDTGTDPKASHDVRRYMDEGTVARSLLWLEEARGTTPSSSTAISRRVPDELLVPLAVMQHAWRTERELGAGDRRNRYAEGRRRQIVTVVDAYRRIFPNTPIVDRLGQDNRSILDGRLAPQQRSNSWLPRADGTRSNRGR